MFSHTSARIVESRNRVGGEGTLVLAGATCRMAKFEDDGWSLIKVLGLVEVLVVCCWLRMICSRTLSLGTGSEMRTESRLVDEVISWLGSFCWGISVITSSEAMSQAFSRFGGIICMVLSLSCSVIIRV